MFTNMETTMTSTTMAPGTKVYFGRTHGEKTLGEVVKVNRTTVQVRQLESRGSMRSYPVGTIWKVPFRLCTPADAGAASSASSAPVTPPAAGPKRPDAVVMREIVQTYSSLSPECLFADGERSRTEAARYAAHYRAKLRDLFREVGHTVSEDEAYRWHDAQRAGRDPNFVVVGE
jgi:hypothetical protein